MIIAVDFDGTCVSHAFPNVGKDIGAQDVLKELISNGHKIILWTMRSDDAEKTRFVLTQAVDWFKKNDITLYGINKNPGQHWSSSPKAYAHLYIDDAAAGCPLSLVPSVSDRPFVNWKQMREFLVINGYIKQGTVDETITAHLLKLEQEIELSQK